MEEAVSLIVCGICCALLLSKNRCIYMLSFFLVVRILVPETTRFLETSISINTIVIVFLALSVLINGKIKIGKRDKTFILILSFYLIYCLVTMFFSDIGSLNAQMGYLLEFVITQCFPAIAAVLIVKRKKDLLVINKTFLISTALACIYGIITFALKKNPYVEMLTGKVLEASAWKGYATFATFTSTTTFGYFLVLAVPYTIFLFYNNKELSKELIKGTLILSLVCVVLCKKRSAMISIMGMCLILIFMFPKTKKYFNKILLGIVACVCAVAVIRLIPSFDKLNNFLTASLFFWNDKAVNVSRGELGSSMELRIRQALYPFVEIRSNLIFGHGFGWCAWYIRKYLLHPVLYGFESIFATSICELGFMGLIVYPVLFYRLYRNYLPKGKKPDFGLIFLLTYIIDIVASGMNYFYLFLMLIVLISKVKECEYGEYDRKSNYGIVCNTGI